MRENRTSGSMSRVGKRPVSLWSPVAACGDRFESLTGPRPTLTLPKDLLIIQAYMTSSISRPHREDTRRRADRVPVPRPAEGLQRHRAPVTFDLFRTADYEGFS